MRNRLCRPLISIYPNAIEDSVSTYENAREVWRNRNKKVYNMQRNIVLDSYLFEYFRMERVSVAFEPLIINL